MKFDFKQQIKVVVIGAVTAFAGSKLGLPDEHAIALGAAVGSLIDVIYFWVVKWTTRSE